MGRFATTVEFYARCREPYPAEFFQTVAERIRLCGDEALLDVGCGPGLLAIGLAPYVKSLTGIDPEPAMIAAARAAAQAEGIAMDLTTARLEEFAGGRLFDLVTIGRALHWLDRVTATAALERLTTPHAHLLVTGSTTVELPETGWLKPYQNACNAWSDDPERARYRVKSAEWFAGSCFAEVENIAVKHRQRVRVDDLVGRALSKSNTSRTVVGSRQAEFEAHLQAVLTPYAIDGWLEEEVVAQAAVFRRTTN